MSNKGSKQEVVCPYTQSTVEAAFGEEVNLFMHCHMRGYDKEGEGLQLHAEFYDKYGAPMEKENSWVEGYHQIEMFLAEHFNVCDTEVMDFPLVAGMGGGVHLYKPRHSENPWNWTGWVPLQRRWLCEGTFFSNRYFLAIRGNEIQNNLWDYDPHDEEEGEDTDDMEYSQLEPNDAYRGGYFFEKNPFGRYLHLITLKKHRPDPNLGRSRRYNYIVHPLAYRGSLNNIPDNGVDGMQWCIINIAKEPHFGPGQPWGRKCHALEIFNDFTLSASYGPIGDEKGQEEEKEKNGGKEETELCYNGTLATDNYRYWFNTYPLEYGEFLLDSALSRGVYLHTLACNDAFYKKMERYDPAMSAEEKKAANFKTMTDPKGALYLEMVSGLEGASHEAPITQTEVKLEKQYGGTKEFDKVKKFLSARPYGFEAVFGYTTLIDTERNLRNFLFERPIPGTGLDEADCQAMAYLLEGNFYSATGVYHIFDYSDKTQWIPYVIKGQKNPRRMCYTIDDNMEMVFTFEKCQSQNKDLLWRYTIMEETDDNTLLNVHGYFKLSESAKTVLDLTGSYKKCKVKWMYFIAINPLNPLRRAWFNAIKGPAFGEPRVHVVDLPKVDHKVFATDKVSGKVLQGAEFKMMECESGNLDFMLPARPSEGEDICVYYLQVCAHQQDITLPATNQSSKDRPPRYCQRVTGLFIMHPEHKTRLKLSNSWDKETVRDGKVFFYEVNAKTGKPQEVNPVPAPYYG